MADRLHNQSSVTSRLPSQAYSSYFLRRVMFLKRTRPSNVVIGILKKTGILHYRGKRAGCNHQRAIGLACSYVTRRQRSISRCTREVCKQNLVFPSVLPLSIVTYINFSCQNVRSAASKSAAICHNTIQNETDICVLTETWHSQDDASVLSSITPTGYYCLDQARENPLENCY